MFQPEKIYSEWSRDRIIRHIIYWFAWLAFYSIANGTKSDLGVWMWGKMELLIMCIKLPITYFAIYYLVPRLLIPKKYLAFFSSILISASVGGIIIWSLYFYLFNPCCLHYTYPSFWTVKISFNILDLIYIISLPTLIKLYQRQALHEKNALLLAEQKLGAELKLLKNQLHPHFLFNTLNNLYSMILTKHPKAADVVVRLSDMMSYMLYECERPLIDLEKEINNLNNYIELEKIRYGNRLDISFEMGGDVQGKMIAPLLLLPFFENAFKHGVEKNEQPSWVRINFWVKENQLTFMIENSLPETVEEADSPKLQSGVGLANVKKRLELLYPDNHVLELKEEDTFLVNLTMNLTYEMSHR